MDDRIKSVNRRISKSTIQIQRMMNTLLSPDRPLPVPHKYTNNYSTHNNPEDNSVPQLTKKSQNLSNVAKYSNIETNASTKFHESGDKFYSTGQSQTPYHNNVKQLFRQTNNFDQSNKNNQDKNYRGYSLNNINHKKYARDRDEIGETTKFAIGEHLYPTSIAVNLQSNHKNLRLDHVGNTENMGNIRNVLQLDHNYVINYALNRQILTQKSKPEEIFDYFHEFAAFFNRPLIKKFKNCLYFGDCRDNFRSHSSKYHGFLYFFNSKLYYGQFQQQHKHGQGVQINFQNKTVYKGTFNRGHKIGKFQVFSNNDQVKYSGHLHKGKYHGLGRLETPISAYVGQFIEGMRNGQGQQYFYKSGLKLKGIFEADKFCNNAKKIDQQQLKQHIKSPPKSRPVAKFNNIFQFSFHDSSQDQKYESPRKNFNIKKLNINNQRKLKVNLPAYESSALESASDDDPLPSPIRRIAYNK